MNSSDNQDPGAEPLDGVTSSCSQCSAPIVFGDFGKLTVPTGWVWSPVPGHHLQPLCARCKAALGQDQGSR